MFPAKEPVKVPEMLIKISKISAIICLLFSLIMIVDLLLPKDVVEVNLSKDQGNREASFGIYTEEITRNTYNQSLNGEKVSIYVTRIFHEIRRITLLEQGNKVIRFPTVDSYMFIFMIFIFLIPSMLLVARKISRDSKIIDLVFSVISNGFAAIVLVLVVRLLLVHVFNVIEVY